MTGAYDDFERRVRERAYEIWLHEGRPEGRAEAHWELARTELAAEENIAATLKPSPLTDDHTPDAEPMLAVDGMADIPGRLNDQGERQDYPQPRKRAPARKKDAAQP